MRGIEKGMGTRDGLVCRPPISGIVHPAIQAQLIRKSVTESRCIEQKTLGAQVRQVGCMLDDALRRQPQALSQRQRPCGAFCEHRGRFLDLDEVGSHRLYAGRMQSQKFFVIHSVPPLPYTITIDVNDH